MESPSDALDRAIIALGDGDKKWALSDAVVAARAYGEGAVQVAVEVVLTEDDSPFDVLDVAVSAATRRISGDGFDVLVLDDAEGRWALAALATKHEGVFLIIGGSAATSPRWQKVERWLAAAHGVFRCYLNHDDFVRVGDLLAERGDVEVSRFSARVITDQSSIARGFPSIERVPRPSHRSAVDEAESNMASIRTLTLTVGSTLTTHLRRLAGATYYSGDVKLFEDVVVGVLEDAAAARRSLMVGRARTTRAAARPVSVNLERGIFNSREETGQLIEFLREAPRLTVAVFHRNPYLHVAVTDEIDGSNYDVMVTETNRIEIIPGFRASLASISRLSTALSVRFGSESVDDRDVPKVTLAELVG